MYYREKSVLTICCHAAPATNNRNIGCTWKLLGKNSIVDTGHSNTAGANITTGAVYPTAE